MWPAFENALTRHSELETLLGQYKKNIQTYERPHRYHFGTHSGVERAEVQEYLLVGT